MDTSHPVLVVDDSPTIRLIVIKHLNGLGFADVDQAEDGGAALERLRQRQYGLMVSDWEMQPMGGEQLLKAARENPKTFKMPIIMITATASRGASWLAGANAFLAKPFSEADFEKAVKSVLGVR